MRVVVAAIGTPFDRSAGSGVPFYALRELQRRFTDLHVIDTPQLDARLARLAPLVRLGVVALREPAVTALFETVVRERVRALRPDVLISIGAAHKVSRLDPEVPLIHVTDGLFSTIIDYYPRYARVSRRSRRLGERVQDDLIERCRAVVLSSQWAAEGAAASYPAAVARMHVVPMGANLDEVPPVALPRSNSGPLKLLFVGYEWRRKGGDTILRVFEALRRRTGTAELHIVGPIPRETRGVAGIVHHGVLSKADPLQAECLAGLFRDSHLLFMPSREEAFGLVFCEACAYSLPSVATRTGGIPSYIDEDNGMLFPLNASIADYVDRILALWADAPRYRLMQLAARRAFELRLNWQSWGEAMERLVYASVPGRAEPVDPAAGVVVPLYQRRLPAR